MGGRSYVLLSLYCDRGLLLIAIGRRSSILYARLTATRGYKSHSNGRACFPQILIFLGPKKARRTTRKLYLFLENQIEDNRNVFVAFLFQKKILEKQHKKEKKTGCIQTEKTEFRYKTKSVMSYQITTSLSGQYRNAQPWEEGNIFVSSYFRIFYSPCFAQGCPLAP